MLMAEWLQRQESPQSCQGHPYLEQSWCLSAFKRLQECSFDRLQPFNKSV